MKIITMERKTLDSQPVEYGVGENGNDYRDWWCVIETKEEEMAYDFFLEQLCDQPEHTIIVKLWNDMVKHAGLGMGVKWGDDDMYGYIRPDEMPPEVGDEYTDGDNDTWLRVE